MMLFFGVLSALAQDTPLSDAAPPTFAAPDGETALACRIVDPRRIDPEIDLHFVTYRDTLATWFSRPYIDELVDGSDPTVWPEALRVASKRKKVADEIGQLVAYRVAVLQNDAEVVWLPADENQGVDPRLHLDRDLYVMVGPGGVVPVSGSRAIPDPTAAPVAAAAPVAPVIDAARFAGQLDAVLVALAVDFASIKGKQRPSNGGFMEVASYDSTIQLDGATGTVFWGTGTGATLSASYGDFIDPKAADAAFASLATAVEAAPKPCCELVKDRIYLDGYVAETYLVFDPGKRMDPRLAKMVLAVEFRKHAAMGPDNEIIDKYSVGLKVHRQ